MGVGKTPESAKVNQQSRYFDDGHVLEYGVEALVTCSEVPSDWGVKFNK